MGNKEFTSWDSLFKYLEEQVEVNINKIGEEIKSVLRNNVRVLWYERPFTPQYYSRTYELIDSISLKRAKKTALGTYEQNLKSVRVLYSHGLHTIHLLVWHSF
jgi:hypothetical protein